MSVTFLVIIVAASVAISWPLGKMMTLAMRPPENPGTFRAGIEKLVTLAGGKHAAAE